MTVGRLCAVALVLMFVSSLLPAATMALPQADGPGAHDHAATGVTLFKAARYPEALALFLTSYTKQKIPEVVWNIGRCYEEMGDLDNALKYFEEFRVMSPTREKKTAARAKIDQVKEKIEAARPEEPVRGEVVVTAENEYAGEVVVVVDGQELHRGTLPTRLLLAPGPHAVSVTGVEGYQDLAEDVDVVEEGLVLVTLKAIPPPVEETPTPLAETPEEEPSEPMAATSTDPRYGDPFLMPSSRTGFIVGMELSPVFRRGGGTASVCNQPFQTLCNSAAVSRPNETWIGFAGQIGMGERAMLTLSVGRRSRLPWNRIHDPFQKAGMELKFRTSVGPKSWSSFVFDLDWAHGHRIISNYEEQVFPELDRVSDPAASPMRQSHALAFTLGEAFGFAIAELVTMEFYIGFAFMSPDVTWNQAWSKLSYIHIPVASHLSFQVSPGAHVGVEARFPISLGPVGNVGVRVVADMALAYRHVIGNVIVGWAVTSAVNHLDDYGREVMGLILTAEYAF